jgi:tripartite-type tricarboxylate transporter receptor subunit TctC
MQRHAIPRQALNRRRLLQAAIATGGAALAPSIALAQAPAAGAWPVRPVRVVVAFTAGGTTDILARAVSQRLAERFRQPFVVDNKPGGGGNIGTDLVAKAPPDGYTLIVNSVGPMAVNPTLYKNLPFDPLVDLVPVVQIADVPNVLVVHPSLPARTFDEFVAHLKANKTGLNYGSTGVGTSSHLAGFMLTQRVGASATHVPYKGATALNDLLGGQIQFMFATIPSVIQHIHGGKLRALAVTSAQRSRSMPEVPTVQERGYPGFLAGSWFGFFAPKGTPAAVIEQINKAVNDMLPSLEAQLVREGADPIGGTPEQFREFQRREFEKWRAIVRESGATAE